jgi:hypothetical protein
VSARVAQLLAVVLFAIVTIACAVPRRAPELPKRDVAWIAVLSGEMPPPIDGTARHAWIVGNVPGERELRRWEFLGHGNAGSTSRPYHHFGGPTADIAIHGIVYDDVPKIVACLDREWKKYDKEHPTYFPIPGPNSNTFVDELLRACSIHVELPATCVGRDYRGPVGASVTETGTGVQVESWLAGIRIGLVEGIEAHMIGLALGLHFIPPAITVPVNPGRIGFGDGAHMKQEELDERERERANAERGRRPRQPPRTRDRRRRRTDDVDDDDNDVGYRRRGDEEREEKRKYGSGAAWMFTQFSHVRRPEEAGGLRERATVGLSARTLYGKKYGWAAGLDLELGAGFPLGFAYGVYFRPLGLGFHLPRNGWVALIGGIGTSGVTARVPPAIELPIELRVEIDLKRKVRVGLRSSATWIGGDDARRVGSPLTNGFADEIGFGSYVRIGRTHKRGRADLGSGTFFGLERREIMNTYFLGFTIGAELDGGG